MIECLYPLVNVLHSMNATALSSSSPADDESDSEGSNDNSLIADNSCYNIATYLAYYADMAYHRNPLAMALAVLHVATQKADRLRVRRAFLGNDTLRHALFSGDAAVEQAFHVDVRECLGQLQRAIEDDGVKVMNDSLADIRNCVEYYRFLSQEGDIYWDWNVDTVVPAAIARQSLLVKAGSVQHENDVRGSVVSNIEMGGMNDSLEIDVEPEAKRARVK